MNYIKKSPHILENYGEIKKASSFSRILNPRSRRKKYVKFNPKSKIHRGQRKLLMTEIEFLTNQYNKCKKGTNIVLYIGASAGVNSIHTYTLIKMFPEFEYHFYDKNDFYDKLYTLDNVKIYKKYFTNKDCKFYKNKNVFLICDLRDLDIGNAKNRDNLNKQNSIVKDDMKLQMNFYKKIKPLSALLKFRLPWKSGKTEYLDGDIYYQLWQGNHSTETRLVPNGKIKVYDNTSYEERLFYFNTETRFRYYNHKYDFYGHCYDCMSEITILENYIKLKKLKMPLLKLAKNITKDLSLNYKKNIFNNKILGKYNIE